MFGKEEQKISDLLKSIVKDNRQLDQRLAKDRVVEAWKVLFDGSIDEYVDAISYYKKVLYVKLNSSVLRQELHLGKEKLKSRLNEQLGENLIETINLK